MGKVTKLVTDPDGNNMRLPASFAQAEEQAGVRLDRRRNYFMTTKAVFVLVTETMACSGCSCDCGDMYGCNHGASGCRECGYTGKRRETHPVPLENQHYEVPSPF
jgi:hypothetical protein